jgi:hypothetical protein
MALKHGTDVFEIFDFLPGVFRGFLQNTLVPLYETYTSIQTTLKQIVISYLNI